jgi:hypothetical protein
MRKKVPKTYDFKEELRKLSIKEQLLFVESYLPDAWEYLHDTADVPLPTYDDNDDLVSWGNNPKDKEED